MIKNDTELKGTKERIDYFLSVVDQIRIKSSSPADYRLYANSYLAEIENMNREVLDYLKKHPSEIEPAKAA